MSSNPTHQAGPILALLFAATMWGVIWYPLRLLEAEGLVGLWLALIIFTGTLVVALPCAWWRRREFIRYAPLLLPMALASAWCNVTFFLAVLEGNVLRVLLLFYLSPLWTVLLSKFLLHEPISRAEKFNLGLAMVGALIMLWEPSLGLPWPASYADWLAISSGFAFALGNVLARRGATIGVLTKTSATGLGGVMLAAAWIVISGTPLPSVSLQAMSGAFALGLGIVLMTFAVLYGVTKLPVHRSAVILLFELVVGAISAELLTDEVVRPQEWLGGALILLAGWLTARRSH